MVKIMKKFNLGQKGITKMKNPIRFAFIAVVSLILSACSSQSTPIQYYLLHTPDDIQSSEHKAEIKTLWLADLNVSDYLLQRGLAFQTDQNSLHISTQHIWAEAFESGFKKKLAHSLGPEIVLDHYGYNGDSDLSLELDLLHLVSTYQGDVVISAEYTVKDKNGKALQKQFSSRIPLASDGYGHAVNVYRTAINELAKDINKSIRNL